MYNDMTTSKGCPQKYHPNSDTMMLISDMALVEDEKFKVYV